MVKITNTLGVSGNILRKTDNTTETTVAIDVSKTFTEYTQQEIKVASGATESISLGGLTNAKFLYVETDNTVEFKAYRGASVIASTVPVDPALLITGNSGKRYGTVSLTNSGAEDAVVNLYMCS